MNKSECVQELRELITIIQIRIDKAVSEHKYEKSAVFRDIKKDIKHKIKLINQNKL